MKKILFLIFLFASGNANAEVNIFACEPEWKSLAEEIGGNKVTAISATTYKQDPHYIRAKPSLLAAIRKADLVICTGAGLEVGWLPVLMQKAAAQQTLAGNVGNLMVADYVNLLAKPQSLDRSQGDVHPEGNPHIHLNPYNILKAGAELNSRLGKIDPDNKAEYQKNWQSFEARWKQKVAAWEADAKSLKGVQVVAHHDSWIYLLDWLGIKQVAKLEPKPGIPPTTGHLEEVLQTLKTNRAGLIIRAPFNSEQASDWLADKAAIPAVVLPYTVSNEGEPKDLFALYDGIIKGLKQYAK